MTAQPFLWGVATSSHQIEGQNIHNDWWQWEAEGHIEGGARSGLATDHWRLFKEDLALAAEMGLNSYRFSLEWSRWEPREGSNDSEASDFYAAILDECERLKLKPMVTLQHFTLPRWLSERGGFSHSGAALSFGRFVNRVATVLGARVPIWCTLNEPMVLVAGSYLGRFMPPATYDPARASQACSELLRAHVLAFDILREKITRRTGPWLADPMEIGFAHNILHFLPDRRFHPVENLLAKVSHRFYNQAWLDATTGRAQRFGIPGLLPRAPLVPEALRRASADFIGINYYTKALVQWRPRQNLQALAGPWPLGVRFARKREEQSDLNWAVHPEGLRAALKLTARYRLPIYITENGIADRDDHLRRGYLHSHVLELAKARDTGLDIRGYYHWSLLDNFEWIKGFWPRFGLYSVNYDTMERRATKSASFYRELIQAHEGRPPSVSVLESLRP